MSEIEPEDNQMQTVSVQMSSKLWQPHINLSGFLLLIYWQGFKLFDGSTMTSWPKTRFHLIVLNYIPQKHCIKLHLSKENSLKKAKEKWKQREEEREKEEICIVS